MSEPLAEWERSLTVLTAAGKDACGTAKERAAAAAKRKARREARKKLLAKGDPAEVARHQRQLEQRAARRAAKAGGTPGRPPAEDEGRWIIPMRSARKHASNDAAHSWGMRTYRAWAKQLTAAQEYAFYRYSAMSSPFNAHLRSKARWGTNIGKRGHGAYYSTGSPLARDDVTQMLNAIWKAPPLKEATRVVRGAQFTPKGGWKVGKEFVDDAFVSTTLGPKLSRYGKRGKKASLVQMNIVLPKGTHGAYAGKWANAAVKKDEAEFILPPGARFAVTSVARKESGMTVVDVQLVGQETRAETLRRIKAKGDNGHQRKRAASERFKW